MDIKGHIPGHEKAPTYSSVLINHSIRLGTQEFT